MNEHARSNINSLWGSFLAEALSRLGIRHVVLSPGSRSTPLAWGIAHCAGLEAVPVLDERAAGFFALGLARQHGRPVALVCTSGSAAANYLPALVEAHHSGVPLIVLTADRPPELRRCAAGQAIDQTRMYGVFAKDYFELPLPEASAGCLRQLRQVLMQAVRLSKLPERGPVHINCPLREPLAPELGKVMELDFSPEALLEELVPDNAGAPLPDFGSIPLPPRVRRGLIIAGSVMADCDRDARYSLWTLASRTGWPIICDALGPWRAAEVSDTVCRIGAYDEILKSPSSCEALAPDFVLQIGPLPTSKVLRQWLSSMDTRTLIASAGLESLDPLHRRSRQIVLPPELLHLLPLPSGEDLSYSELWKEAEGTARAKLNAELDSADGLSEEAVARELFRSLPAESSLFVANSMSVRHVERYAELGHSQFRVFFSRGANGIDGTVATAMGMAHGGRGFLLTGDLAMLHDAGAMLLAGELKGALTVVLVDNKGGGIFRRLPVAKLEDAAFERFFVTPQNVDFQALASAYGAEYSLVRSLGLLRGELKRDCTKKLRILHLRMA